jgi:hypothetical protein
MNGGPTKGSPASPPTVANRELRELTELLQDLHGLLVSYAPLWYTEELDARATKVLAKLTLPSTPGKSVQK